MFATRSIVHALIPEPEDLRYGVQPTAASPEPLPPAASRLDPQVRDPLPKIQKFLYTLSIYRKFTHLLVTEIKLENWHNEEQTLQFQRKVRASFCATPVSKLANCPKTGTIGARKYNTGQSHFQNWHRNWHITRVPLSPPVTQITESLPTRHTKWYNGWYNNQLKEL